MGTVVVTVEDGRPQVRLRERDHEVDLPALWLRQHSQEATECDPITGQRLFDPHLLPIDLHLVAAESMGERLVATFSDGHTSTYDLAVLLAHRPVRCCQYAGFEPGMAGEELHKPLPDGASGPEDAHSNLGVSHVLSYSS